MKNERNNMVMTEAEEKYCIALYMFFGKGEIRNDAHLGVAYAKNAANLGCVHANFLLGTVYRDGICGIEKDEEEAKRWFGKGADLGSVESHMALAHMLLGKDDITALAHLIIVEEEGKLHGDAYHMLSTIYANSETVRKDFDKVFRYAKLSLANGDERGLGYLAHCYRFGLGVGKDVEVADGYYRLLADWCRRENDYRAMYECGMVEYVGKEAGPNYERAFRHFLIAAQGGEVRAMQMVAKMYKKGLGTQPNRAESRRWRELAATVQKGKVKFTFF